MSPIRGPLAPGPWVRALRLSYATSRAQALTLVVEPVRRVDLAGLFVKLRPLGLCRRLGDPGALAIAGGLRRARPVFLGEQLVDRVDVGLDRGGNDVRRDDLSRVAAAAARARGVARWRDRDGHAALGIRTLGDGMEVVRQQPRVPG